MRGSEEGVRTGIVVREFPKPKLQCCALSKYYLVERGTECTAELQLALVMRVRLKSQS
jgi:hypothetical protein